ncbi:hypothetical protein B0H13DRAFT_1911097 [Mycena leptocephala]|nr:hypothetical protein B0H13DRAFT_1911097 [Mycena leptocephala]
MTYSQAAAVGSAEVGPAFGLGREKRRVTSGYQAKKNLSGDTVTRARLRMNLSMARKKRFIIVLAHAHAIELLREVQHPQDRLAVVATSVQTPEIIIIPNTQEEEELPHLYILFTVIYTQDDPWKFSYVSQPSKIAIPVSHSSMQHTVSYLRRASTPLSYIKTEPQRSLEAPGWMDTGFVNGGNTKKTKTATHIRIRTRGGDGGALEGCRVAAKIRPETYDSRLELSAIFPEADADAGYEDVGESQREGHWSRSGRGRRAPGRWGAGRRRGRSLRRSLNGLG